MAKPLDPKVVTLSGILRPQVVIRNNTPELPATALEESLGDGRTVEQLKLYQEDLGTFRDAAYLAMGEASIAHMAQNPDVDAMSYSIPMGHDTTAAMFPRTAQIDSKDGSGDPRVVHGANHGPSHKVGGKSTYKAVRKHLQQFAVENGLV